MNQVGLILTVLSLSSSLLIHATQDEAVDGELQSRSDRVVRSPDADGEKRYPNTVLFGKRAPIFKFGKRRVFKLGKREEEEDALADAYDGEMMGEKRFYGKMPIGSLYKGDKRYYPTDQRHVTLEDLMERENRKFYFGKRTEEADRRGERKFFFGKRNDDDLDEDKRKMVYFGKRTQDEDPEMDKRRMVYFGKRDPSEDSLEEDKRKMVYFGKREPEKRKMVYFGKREPDQTIEEKRKMVYFGKRTAEDKSSR